MVTSRKVVKVAYVCGPLTELAPWIQTQTKTFYSKIGDVCGEVLGRRAFVPHEHYDPVRHANFTPSEVDAAEHRQVTQCTSVVIIVAIEPTWGGGIEVGWIRNLDIPAILLKPQKRVSRLLLGSPNLVATHEYQDAPDALKLLADALSDHVLKRRPLTA